MFQNEIMMGYEMAQSSAANLMSYSLAVLNLLLQV